jgi:Uma2 family endonuclease
MAYALKKNLANLPPIEELPDSDDTPVDNELQTFAPQLLHDILSQCWSARKDWFFGINMGIYHTTGENPKKPIVPDGFLCLGVAPPKEPQRRLSYVVWKEKGIVPILTLECVSQTYGNEYDQKMIDYAKLGVLYYVIYNPHYHKRDKHAPFELYRLENGQYMSCIGQPFFMPEIGLAIGPESGTYRKWQRDWLYWYKKDRTRLLTAEEQAKAEAGRANVAEEQAKAEAGRANVAEQRANAAEQRAEQLAQLLREQGIDPDKLS